MVTKTKSKSSKAIILEFLGSMNLAITILVAIAIASVIGTVLQQNQPYTDYIIKFGPFWHEVFKALDLYDVYGAVWFLLLLAFLTLSTSVCVYRNAPTMLRDMRHFRLAVKEKSLRSMHNSQQWTSGQSIDIAQQQLSGFLQHNDYRVRVKDFGDHRVIAAMKGIWNRPGYILAHLGIVVICIGGLIDGNLGLAFKEWTGKLQPETRDISADKVPATARLKPEDSISFRGSISLPEGSASNLVFLNIRDGYLVQELPFVVELKDFRIEHYASGQPKSFESDLIIHDDQLSKPLQKTISVNHPLLYRGYAIYQASFGDGGSKLNLRAWPLHSKTLQQLDMSVLVHGERQLETPVGKFSLEMGDFKMFNIFPATEAEHIASGKKFINFGPSMQFKLRDASGVALEYQNYMLPVTQNGQRYFLSGMRKQPNQPFRYLHIPADKDDSLQRFMNFHALLNDPVRIKQIAEKTVEQAMLSADLKDKKMRADIVQSMLNLLGLFNEGGYVAIDDDITRKVPKEKQVKVAEAYLKVLQSILRAAYYELLQQEGVDIKQAISVEDTRFYDSAVSALAGIGAYGAPFYLQLVNFEHRESSGLQITRAPGKNIVYLGCVMLIAGIFMMFYISYRRVWFMLKPDADKLEIIFAGSGNRNQQDFAKEFNQLEQQVDKIVS